MLLRRLKIVKLFGVAPTELVFCNEFNVLLGKNATGKTTLLRVIEAIVSDNFKEILDRFNEVIIEFEIERVMTNGKRRLATFQLDVTKPTERPGGDDRSEPKARDALRVHGTLRVVSDGNVELFSSRGALSIVGADGEDLRIDANTILRPQYLWGMIQEFRNDEAGSFNRPDWEWWPANMFGRFDEALDVYRKLVAGSITVFMPDKGGQARVSGTMLSRTVVADVKKRIRETPSLADQTFLQFSGDSIAPLAEAANLFGFSTTEVILLGSASTAVPGGKRISFGQTELVFKDSEGNWEFGDQLSFGQRRMLAFMFYWHETSGAPAVLDELVNGLHHEWVDRSIGMLRDRQCFYASQNPLLLDELRFRSIEEVERTFVVCSRTNQRGPMTWAPLTKKQATSLWRSHKAGVQHVHEILRDEGLW